MLFCPQAISGVHLVRPELITDERGAFARTFCVSELEKAGLITCFEQSSISWNLRRGTVRGMHYSVGPNAETKLVRCTKGAILDVLVDVRPHSAYFGQTLSFELNGDNRDALYIPAGVAHGFQTLLDDSEILYMIDKPFTPGAARGFRWNDAVVSAEWPLPVSVISERDRTYPDFAEVLV